jgi:acyl-CoA synthetase (AMP-forming)/AMP-acid ligase II
MLLPNGPEMATALLAVTSVGTAVPLNPESKPPELERYLARLRPRVLVVAEGMNRPASDVPVAVLTTLWDKPAGVFSLAAPDRPIGTRAVSGGAGEALILHTSGTTSEPKMVPLSHANLRASVDNLVRTLRLGASDKAMHLLPMFHIGGLIDVLAAPLAAGGSVMFLPSFSAAEFLRCLDRDRPTWSQAVPAVIKEIVSLRGAGSPPAEPALRFMRSVSAALPTSLMEEFEKRFGVPVIEIYGMTETAGQITSNPLPPGARKPGSVGLAAGPDVAILDGAGKALPATVVGEVAVRGRNVMSGYLSSEGSPTGENIEWLRTGDLGFVDADGYLFLTGRVKELINRGGEKVSPREVEDVLCAFPGVAEAAVYPVPDSTLGEDVGAVVVARPGVTLSRTELASFLGERLAYFKVPRRVRVVEAIPKGPTGKVQRVKLHEALGPDTSASAGRPVFREPRTVLERTIAELWQEVLPSAPATRIGLDDDFFDLGGDSLKAASIVNEIHRRWRKTVYVSAIFDAPTIGSFEAFLRKHHPAVIALMLGREAPTAEAFQGKQLSPEEIEAFRRSIRPHHLAPVAGRRKNPPMVFVLSPPRSGSTLLRSMLGGHSGLFAPPELYLLTFDTLADRKAWFSGSQRFQLEGNIRAIMELLGLGPDEAQQYVAAREEASMSVADYYREMQQMLSGRVLVDKTPFYASHVATLRRAEEVFDDVRYVHLIRHPYGMIRSFEEAGLDQLWYPRIVGGDEAARTPNPLSMRSFAEAIWLVLHQNILTFLQTVPTERQYRLSYEDLVGMPETTVRGLCSFLGIPFEPAMLDPQADTKRRMTDGIRAESRMIGDMNFHQHRGVVAERALLWKSYFSHAFLSPTTAELATDFGYETALSAPEKRIEIEI